MMEARNRTAGRLEEAAAVGGSSQDPNLREGFVKKWAPYLRGVPEGRRRGDLATLYENTLHNIETLQEDANTTGVTASYTKYLFPMLRRVFPNLIANEIVSVQPMTGPVGAVFTYEYKYGNTKGAITAGQNLIQTFNQWYSSEYVDQEVIATGNGTDYGSALSSIAFNLAWKPVRALDSDAGYSVRITDGTQTLIDDGSGDLSDVNGNGGGTINYTTGKITGAYFATAPANGVTIYASYWYNSELNDQIPDVELDVTLSIVKARNRKLRIRWSSEASDDMRALHGMEIESELINGVSNEMGLEVDREITRDLLANAFFSDTYDFSVDSPVGVNTEIGVIRGFLSVASEMSANIWKANHRGRANFMVVAPRMLAVLEQLKTHGDFIPAGPGILRPSSYGDLQSDYGVALVGTLMNQYRVFVDPYQTETQILMGFKGQSFLDAGYVYAPYVPFQLTNTMSKVDDFSFVKGLRTRYATKMLRPNMYGVINVTYA